GEPWADEVSSLLLGLLELSGRRYLGRSLLAEAAAGAAAAGASNSSSRQAAATDPATGAVAAAAAPVASPPVAEEERAGVFWEAPFPLLVQDDSPDALLEYVNRTGLQLLRLPSFQAATGGVSLAGLMDPQHPPSHTDWAWACSEALEKPERHSTIPILRLRIPSSSSSSSAPSSSPPTLVELVRVTVFAVDSLEGEPIGVALTAAEWRVLPGAGQG
ncbi:hypothetical protein Agub_g3571, partial [Astrephomene gubernaculifera]